MGSFLSKKRHLKRVSCTQAKMQAKNLDYAVNAEIMKRCSTFGAENQPTFESPTKVTLVANKVVSESPRQSPAQNKQLKYDPVYALWKNAFEDHELRSPRKVSPIKDESSHQPNITGVVAGQLTPKGFPSYTDLRKNMNNGKSNNDENEHGNGSTLIGRRLSFQMSLNCPLSPREFGSAQADPKILEQETIQEHTYVNALPDLQQHIVDEANESNEQVSCEISSNNVEYTPKFLAMVANEKAAVIQKFFKNLKDMPVSAGCKKSLTMPSKCVKPAVKRQPQRSKTCRLPFKGTHINASPRVVMKDHNGSYNVYKEYFFL